MRLSVLLIALVLVAAAALAQPPAREPVREGNAERLIDDGAEADIKAWAPAEGTLTADKKHVRQGDTALRLHIDVNWETGEKNYPVGWPRMYRGWPESQRDWRKYDYLEFSLFTETSRKSLPANPLGLIVQGNSGEKVLTRELSELRIGEWTDYRLPLADIPDQDNMTGVGFYISESNYKHGDVLDFWIDNISLVRLTEPALVSTILPEKTIAGDAGYLPLDLNLMGVAADKRADITWQFRTSAGSAATGKMNVGRGKSRVYLTLPPSGLKAGDYELVLKTGGTSLSYPIKVVGSPWQEVSK